MLMHFSDVDVSAAKESADDLTDVLLRLLVNLTNPALLLYREELPKDGPGRRHFLELIEILQGYKAAFALQPVWTALGKRLQSVLEMVSYTKYVFHLCHVYICIWVRLVHDEDDHKSTSSLSA